MGASKRYKSKMAWLIKSGMDADEASRRARGYAGGKAPRKPNDSSPCEFEELPDEVLKLPEEAQKIWAQAYNDAIAENDETDSAVAAWKAVDNAGYKKDGETWIKASELTGRFKGLIALQESMLTPSPSGMQYAATSIVEILRTGEWVHPVYGKIKIQEKDIDGFVTSFYNNVRGVDLAVDQEHKPEEGAEGWFKKLWKIPHPDDDGFSLMAEIQWTWHGEQLIREGIYRYFSADFDFEWTDPENGEKFKNVLFGGALTNRPFIKHMEPIILSEGIIETLGFVFREETKGVRKNNNNQGGEPDVKLTAEHLKALGLSETATEAEVLTAIMAASQRKIDPPKPDEQAIQLSEKVKTLTDTVVAAQTQVKLLSEQNAKLAEDAKNTRWEKVSQDAFREGRMTVQLAEKFKPLFMASPEAIEPIIADLPKVIQGEKGHNGAGGDGIGNGGSKKLSEPQSEVAKMLGLTEDQFEKGIPSWMKQPGKE